MAKSKTAPKKARTKRSSGKRDKPAYDFFVTVVGNVIADIFDNHRNDPWPQQARRLRIGAAGGLIYAGLKGLFYEGIAGVIGLFNPEPGARWQDFWIGFIAAIVIAAVAGAVASWLSAQRSGRMQFIIGMFGLQILVTLFPGLQAKEARAERSSWLIENVIPVAYADNDELTTCIGDSAFEKGFKTFFGARERYDRFAVVVASGKNPADAQSKLKAVAAEDPSLKLRVAPRSCDNDFYPVLATDYLPRAEAKAILDRVRKVRPDAYLSGGPRE